MKMLERKKYQVTIKAGQSIVIHGIDFPGEMLSIETVPYTPAIRIYVRSAENGANMFQVGGRGFWGLPGTLVLWPRFDVALENTGTTDWSGTIVIKVANYI